MGNWIEHDLYEPYYVGIIRSLESRVLWKGNGHRTGRFFTFLFNDFFFKIGSPHRVLEIWFLHDYKMRMAMLQSFKSVITLFSNLEANHS